MQIITVIIRKPENPYYGNLQDKHPGFYKNVNVTGEKKKRKDEEI